MPSDDKAKRSIRDPWLPFLPAPGLYGLLGLVFTLVAIAVLGSEFAALYSLLLLYALVVPVMVEGSVAASSEPDRPLWRSALFWLPAFAAPLVGAFLAGVLSVSTPTEIGIARWTTIWVLLALPLLYTVACPVRYYPTLRDSIRQHRFELVVLPLYLQFLPAAAVFVAVKLNFEVFGFNASAINVSDDLRIAVVSLVGGLWIGAAAGTGAKMSSLKRRQRRDPTAIFTGLTIVAFLGIAAGLWNLVSKSGSDLADAIAISAVFSILLAAGFALIPAQFRNKAGERRFRL